jgi:15-cis-phytoene synthase
MLARHELRDMTARDPHHSELGPDAGNVQVASPASHVSASLAAAYETCTQLVREGDPDRYFSTLFAPARARPHLMALYAFNQDIAQVRERVSDPLPGEVRLQWWRDLLEGDARGDAQAHPVAAALLDTAERFYLPRQALTNLIDARIFDLYDDPMPDLMTLEGYCGETSSALIRLACLVLAGGKDVGGADAAGHAGVAYAITGLLRAFPWHAARGQLFVPTHMLSAHGATREDVITGRGGPGVIRALADLRQVARKHLERTRAVRSTISPEIAPAFLATALVEPYLKAMEMPGYNPFQTRVDLPNWKKLWVLWRQAKAAMR